MNFKNFGNEPPGDGGGRTPGNFPLARQSSVYSLTFDEFQNTLGGGVRDFGSMNMDELLKNIWTAEEAQTIAATTASSSSMVGGGQEGQAHGGGYLQRQGSLTLPRTLSTKTVDEVWRDLAKETVGAKDGIGVAGGSDFPQAQRQQTLGEMTLEEFLLRAGVVREDAQLQAKPTSTSGYFGDFSRPNHSNISTSVGFGFQQMNQSNGLMGNRINEVNNQASLQSANLPLNVNGVRSNQQQLFMPQIQPQQQQQQQQQQTFPKKPTLAYANPVHMSNGTQLSSPGIRSGIVGMTDTSMNGNLIQNAALPSGGLGMFGLSTAGPLAVATGSPAVSSDGLGKSNGDTSSVSPAPYVFNNGGGRGRRVGNGVEKVIERRQRRMIKNRESAARSRARKQAYTVELEAEVAKLKEENQELRRKQAEILEMRKNQVMEMMNEQQGGAKRQCLRRTQTGPW